MLKEILEETYGIMVYQEQVMMIAQKMAGYSLGAGDVLRKAMGKKDREEMAKQKEKFRKGAIENGIEEKTALAIFDKIEKFASYGFNKSHAAAYGYLSWVTAYLKANYPKHWMAALMTSDRDDLSKVTKIIRECQAMRIAILPPDINESDKVFVATEKGIRFAMTAVKGVGEGVVETITKERAKNSSFTSLYDFIMRIDTHKVGKKIIECLIEAGAFDFTEWSRSALFASVQPMFQEAQKQQKEKQRGELNFFSLIEDTDARFKNPPDVPLPLKMDILRREKELLGFYLTGHPLDGMEKKMQRLSCVGLHQLDKLEKGVVCRVGFVIENVSMRLTNRTGRKFAILTIGDRQQRFELPIWSDLFEEKGHLLVENQLLYAILQVDRDEDGTIHLQCHWLHDLMQADEKAERECDLAYDKARMQTKMSSFRGKKQIQRNKTKEEPMQTLIVQLDADKMPLSHICAIKQIFRLSSGKSKVELKFQSAEKLVGKISIAATWGVEISEELKSRLKAFPSVIDILIEAR